MGTRELILATAVPLAAAALLLAIAHALAVRTRDADRPGPRLAWLVPVLLGGGVVLGAWVWQTRIELWPDAVTHRFPAVAGVAALAGLLAALTPLARPALSIIPTLAAGAFVAWAFLGSLHESLISEPARWGWIAGVALIAGAQSWAIETGARALPGWRAPALLWLLLGLIPLGATAGVANAPLLLWPPAAVLFALAGVGLFRREDNLLRGVGPALAVLISGVAAFANWFGGEEEQWPMFALLVASPLPLALAALPPLRTRPRARLALAAVPALALAGAQAAIAVPDLMEATSPPEYQY